MEFWLEMEPKGEAVIELSARFEVDRRPTATAGYGAALGEAERAAGELCDSQCVISTSNEGVSCSVAATVKASAHPAPAAQ